MSVRTSDIILGWIREDGYSLSEAGWIQARDRKFHFEVTAEKDGHRHIVRGPDRESAVVNLARLFGCPLDEQLVRFAYAGCSMKARTRSTDTQPSTPIPESD